MSTMHILSLCFILISFNLVVPLKVTCRCEHKVLSEHKVLRVCGILLKTVCWPWLRFWSHRVRVDLYSSSRGDVTPAKSSSPYIFNN